MLALQRTPRKRGEYRMFTSVIRFYERMSLGALAVTIAALVVCGLFIPAAAVSVFAVIVVRAWEWVEAEA